MELPTAEFINSKRVEAFKQKIHETMTSSDLSVFRDLIEQYCSEHQHDPLDIAAATARMFQGETPLLLQIKPEKNYEEKTPFFFDEPSESRKRTRPSQRERNRREDGQTEEGMETYRIEVGRDHGVQPGHIVGAIAGETGMASKYIGRIKLFNEFSTVDLPQDMPEEMIRKLKTAWICKRQLNISLDKAPRQIHAVAEEPTRGIRPVPFPQQFVAPENSHHTFTGHKKTERRAEKVKVSGKGMPKRRDRQERQTFAGSGRRSR
jgi:ATP-dependent RNA helicase DeaD